MLEGPTHAQLKARPFWLRDAAEFAEFVQHKTRNLPAGFASEIARQWQARRKQDKLQAARWGFGQLRTLASAEKLNVGHGDGDADLCRKAEREARLMAGMLDAVAVRVAKLKAGRAAEWLARLTVRAQAWAVRLDLRRRGVEDKLPKGKHISRAGIVSRARDPVFWRRILRGLHARMLEGMAISLGLVHAGKRGGCYVSAESLKRRRGQRARNRAALAATVAVNDRGEADTLAEIAAKGVANGEVRRAELMTRISGFEVIANDLGHRAWFVTVTCPSRMHKWRRGARDTQNPAYDGTLPGEANQYLAKQWARFRAAAQRAGLGLYGFRIAEPHHDGCPHWHMLLWSSSTTAPTGKRKRGADASMALGLLLLRYFLANDEPHEKGADRYRVKIECIDPAKGSAVAYVAKYVAKNIDGYKVENDLYGNPAMESSERVEAWASTHRIRQFQQIGGAPVGVWRELRRVHPGAAPVDAGQQLHDALMMVNVTAVDRIMGGEDSAISDDQRIRKGWAAYNMAQGGPMARRRDHTLRVLRDQSGEANRYGELGAPKTAGVVAVSRERFTLGICTMSRVRIDEVESERARWVTSVFQPEDNGSMARAVQRMSAAMHERQKDVAANQAQRTAARAERRQARLAQGEALRPWTRVNNCTPAGPTIGEMMGAQVYRTKKRGQVFRWAGDQRKPHGSSDERNGPG